MKVKIMNTSQEFYLSKRGLIETVIDQLKHCCQIEHTRHRRPANGFVNLVLALVAYSFKERKPFLNNNALSPHTTSLMPS